jgi:hypothetical protein
MEIHQHTLAGLDRDEYGSLIFRRGDYGILITKEEAFKNVKMVTQKIVPLRISEIQLNSKPYTTHRLKDRGTEGKGLCEILALAGTIVPQLNS